MQSRTKEPQKPADSIANPKACASQPRTLARTRSSVNHKVFANPYPKLITPNPSRVARQHNLFISGSLAVDFGWIEVAARAMVTRGAKLMLVRLRRRDVSGMRPCRNIAKVSGTGRKGHQGVRSGEGVTWPPGRRIRQLCAVIRIGDRGRCVQEQETNRLGARNTYRFRRGIRSRYADGLRGGQVSSSCSLR